METPALDLAARFCPTERFGSKTTVFSEGDPANDILEIIEGVLKLHKLLPDGRPQIAGFLFRGDFLGLALQDRYVYTAETVTPAKLGRYGRAELNKLFERVNDLGKSLRMTTSELCAAQDRMVLLDRKGAMERLASFLLLIVGQTSKANGNDDNEVDLPMTRVDIADYLELSPATVSRVLRRLCSDDVIEETDADKIALLRPDELCRRAEGACQSWLKTAHFYPTNRATWPT